MNLRHPISAMPWIQRILVLLALCFFHPLLVVSTQHLSATSASPVLCPAATHIALPISSPCPVVPDMTLQHYLFAGHCCLQIPFNPNAHGLWSTPPNCNTIDWSFPNDVCMRCVCAHFTHVPHFLETSGRLRARDGMNATETEVIDAEQERTVIPGDKVVDWVCKDHTGHPDVRDKSYLVYSGIVLVVVLVVGRTYMFFFEPGTPPPRDRDTPRRVAPRNFWNLLWEFFTGRRR